MQMQTVELPTSNDMPGVNDIQLKVRTLEILWHCNERNEEAVQFGMQSNVVEGITSIDFNAHSNRLLTTGGDMCIRMWQVSNSAIDSWLANGASDMTACSRHVCTMRSGSMPLTARWSPQGEMIASAHCEGRVCLWWRERGSGVVAAGSSSPSTYEGDAGDADELEEVWKDYRHLSGHMNDVYDLCFSADSRYLLTGASDGSIVIHDLEGSTYPVLQLAELHTKFCRGVAWDPWDRYVSTFGSEPALQCFTHVPRREGAGGGGFRRMHLAGQRKCQGDFLKESCAMSFRRLSWSPDGLLLAVPYGKYRPSKSRQQQQQQKNSSTDAILSAIEAKEKQQAQQQQRQSNPAQGEEKQQQQQQQEDATNKEVARGEEEDEEQEDDSDLMHCINIYSRGSIDKIAARLAIRGFSEVRGVLWAPCFFEPYRANHQSAVPAEADVTTNKKKTEATTVEAEEDGELKLVLADGERSSSSKEEGAQTDGRLSSSAAAGATAAASVITPSTTERPEASRPNASGAWGPSDYVMALAAWTSDAVIVYTTANATRHSDFTDLHVRSITDVAWSSDGKYLFTASLDGYVSVISFGTSLSVSHRLPNPSASPATATLHRLLSDMGAAGYALEAQRSSKTAQEAEDRRASSKANTPGVVVVVKKKRKVEKSAPAAPLEDVDLQQLEALLPDV